MDEIDLKYAPGCFGAGLAYDETAIECRECPFATRCRPISDKMRRELISELGVKIPSPATNNLDIKSDIEPLPEKVRELIGRIERKGIDVAGLLKRGENPFHTSPAFLRVACHLLLRLPNGVDRAGLRIAFMHKLGWTASTAIPHATQTFQVLIAFGAAVEVAGRLKLRK